jgi:hypothetical protein
MYREGKVNMSVILPASTHFRTRKLESFFVAFCCIVGVFKAPSNSFHSHFQCITTLWSPLCTDSIQFILRTVFSVKYCYPKVFWALSEPWAFQSPLGFVPSSQITFESLRPYFRILNLFQVPWPLLLIYWIFSSFLHPSSAILSKFFESYFIMVNFCSKSFKPYFRTW